MLRSNCKQALDNIQAYIVESVDLDYFGLEEAPDYKTACMMLCILPQMNMLIVGLLRLILCKRFVLGVFNIFLI